MIYIPLQKEAYADCEHCPLYNRPFVPSHKPQEYDLIVVGEAPGYDEARLKRPFVGASGKLLDATLKQLGIDPTRVYKTNSVLCHPEYNADPDPQSTIACSVRLQEELRATNPEIPIIALGAAAMHALGGSGKITQQRGVTFHSSLIGRIVMPTLHPAYVLRSPNNQRYLRDDIQSTMSARGDRDWLSLPYAVIDAGNVTRFIQYLHSLPDKTRIVIDMETSGLNPFPTREGQARPLCMVWNDSDKRSFIIPANMLYFGDLYEVITQTIDRVSIETHNGKFDQLVCSELLDIHFDISYDTMLASYAIDEQKGVHRLKQLGARFLNVPDYEKQLILQHLPEDPDQRDYGKIPRDQLYQYAAIDGAVTYALKPHLEEAARRDNVTQVVPFLIRASNNVMRVERSGIWIDEPYMRLVETRLDRELNTVKTVLQTLTNDPSFNPNVYADCSYFLYSYFRLKHTKKLSYKTKPDSSNAEALEALPDHPFVNALREYRKIQKMLSTYVRPVFEMVDNNGRLHVNFKLHGTETGRLSAARGQHGIPRDQNIFGQMIRGAYGADITKGKCLIVADYSQAELRVLACVAQLQYFLDQFRAGADIHESTAILMFGDRYLNATPGEKKRLRTIAKNLNFGKVYQGGAEGIRTMIKVYGEDIPLPQMRQFVALYDQRLPDLNVYVTQQFRFAKTNGYVDTIFGRKRRFPLITADNIDEIRKASVNMPIQSMASDITLTALCQLVESGYNVVHFVHDSLLLECDIDQAPEVAQHVTSVMESIGSHYFPDVPWVVDTEITQFWAKARPDLSIEDLDTSDIRKWQNIEAFLI